MISGGITISTTNLDSRCMKPKTGSHHFSDQVEYDLLGTSALIKLKKTAPDILRIAETWGLAYYHWLTVAKTKQVDEIIYDISSISVNDAELELFRRRISYLKLNNSFKISIKAKSPVNLYLINDLINRPSSEIIIQNFKQRTSDDIPGRLEKDFQAFLFGGSIVNNVSPNQTSYYNLIYRRLGVLGIDFFQLKKDYSLIREFPTGVFNNTVSKNNRLLPTKYIDIVAFNKHDELAIIELKLNDSKLHVISQLLDYALFALSYKGQIFKVIDNHFGGGLYPQSLMTRTISCYVANNHFHDKFDEISRYYSPKNSEFNLKIKKIVIGETTLI
jgi:hypothetical protein